MSNTQTIKWDGKSGREYEYQIFPLNTEFKEEPGNYAFAKETKPGTFRPIYFGQTKNLNQRLENHEKEECAKRNGASHIHVHLNPIESDRLSEEKDLILKWQPVCNDQ